MSVNWWTYWVRDVVFLSPSLKQHQQLVLVVKPAKLNKKEVGGLHGDLVYQLGVFLLLVLILTRDYCDLYEWWLLDTILIFMRDDQDIAGPITCLVIHWKPRVNDPMVAVAGLTAEVTERSRLQEAGRSEKKLPQLAQWSFLMTFLFPEAKKAK